MIALVDIDGTIADLSHRLHYIQSKPKDWPAFFDAMTMDTPIIPMRNLVHAIKDSYDIIFMSGRPDSHRSQTEYWLANNNFGVSQFRPFMRKAGDYRADHIVKAELLAKVLETLDCQINQVGLVIDDRKQVVDMWRELGLLTLQCKDGDY
jgi:hypothetical protein